MDKFLNSAWFVRLLSFVIAVMLFVVVSVEQQGLGGTMTAGEEGPRRLNDVPVEVLYDEEKYIVSGVPETVTVLLEGSDNLIQRTMLANDYRVFIDLRKKDPGTHTVPIRFSGFPDELEVRTVPAETKVTIYEKATRTFPVQIELLNEGKLPEGYKAGEPIVSPNQVQVTAAKSTLDEIAFVKGYVDVGEAEDTIEKTVPLNVYDRDGNELDVELSTAVVEVKVPITGPSKTVPLEITTTASLPEGLSIAAIDVEPAEVTLFGPEEVLEDIEYVGTLEVSLEGIEKDTQVTLEVPVPEGVKKVNPEKVTVTIKVAKQEEKVVRGVAIDVFELADSLDVIFEDPADRTVAVTVLGAQRILKTIGKEDLEAYIDVSDLSVGEHTVDIVVNGPQNITWQLENEQAKIQIVEEENR